MFLDSAAKNYPGILQDQNKYDTFDILTNPNILGHPEGLMRSPSTFFFFYLAIGVTG